METAPARILVAEDEPVIRRLTLTLLEASGYEVKGVPDGRSALASLEEASFDVILSDMVMPEMGGPELLRTLRARGDTTPFVLMTGYSEGNDDDRFGCLVLPKPFGGQALFEVIERALGKADLNKAESRA